MFQSLFRTIEIDTLLSPARRRLFEYFWCLSALSLIFFTFDLWNPSGVYPQVPFLRWLCAIPVLVDRVILVVMVVLPLLLLLRYDAESHPGRLALSVFLGGMTCLFLLNQHRFQPWAYQFLLLGLSSLLFPLRRVAFWWRTLTISIYFFSALSKFDQSFADELGRGFLEAAGGLIGARTALWPQWIWRTGVWCFPLWELLVAILLCFRWGRIWGMAGAWIMHVALIFILGPWGLNHHAGVLVWNAFFICQAGILFWPCQFQGPACPLRTVAAQQIGNRRELVTQSLFGIILLSPILEPFGLLDVWPGWGLYASHAERVGLLVQSGDRDRFPPAIQKELIEVPGEPDWLRLRIARWSLDSLKAPIYPQGRFQLGVCAAVIQKYDLRDRFQIVWEKRGNRFSKSRQVEEYRNWEELQGRLNRFFCNGFPRPF